MVGFGDAVCFVCLSGLVWWVGLFFWFSHNFFFYLLVVRGFFFFFLAGRKYVCDVWYRAIPPAMCSERMGMPL